MNGKTPLTLAVTPCYPSDFCKKFSACGSSTEAPRTHYSAYSCASAQIMVIFLVMMRSIAKLGCANCCSTAMIIQCHFELCRQLGENTDFP